MNITILGSGNGGVGLAALFELQGHRVCLYSQPDYAHQLHAIHFHDNTITVTGAINSQVKVSKLTTDLSEATKFSDLVFVILPSFAQDALFEQLLSHGLTNKTTLVSIPGNFASACFSQVLREKNMDLFPNLLESNTLPIAARITGPASVHIFEIKKSMQMLIYQSNAATKDIQEKLEKALPLTLDWTSDWLYTGLSSLGAILHPAVLILNTGWTETTSGDYCFYSEGVSPSVARVLHQLDNERQAIGQAYDIHLEPYLELASRLYGTTYKTHEALFKKSTQYIDIKAPKEMRHRYLSEVIPYILTPWYHLAKERNVEVPCLTSLIHLGSFINDTDYFNHARKITVSTTLRNNIRTLKAS